MKKKILVIISAIVVTVAIPLLMDILILGNDFPSNISNDVWAGFLGSYIGGIATMLAVVVTIADNNKKIKQHRIEDDEVQREQRRLSIKPYLDTRFNFFNHTVEVGPNDRIFDLANANVKYVRFNLTAFDRKHIEVNQYNTNNVYLKYLVRNIGAGSAVGLKLKVNDRTEEMAIAKDEYVNLYFLITIQGEKEVNLNISFDFWDVETRGHYYQDEQLRIEINKEDDDMSVVPVYKNKVTQIL